MRTKCHWKDCEKMCKQEKTKAGGLNICFSFLVWYIGQMERHMTQTTIQKAMDCRIREQCVESDIQALETPAALLLQQGYKASIHSGVPVGHQFTQRMPHYTTQQSLLAVFQCREFFMHAINQQGIRLTFYDASTNVHVRQTLSFCRTVNPEEKRRIICDMFVKVVDRTANDLNVTWDNLLLGQVALRPDLIESASHMASSRAYAMKTHHNDSEMVLQLRIYGRVVEPLKGRELGLSTELLERLPFPGPGLSIQIIYAEELFMEADFVETQVLIRLMVDYANMAAKEHVLLNRMEIATLEEERLVLEELSSRSQYVATLLNIRIVGVKMVLFRFMADLGYCRTYDYCVVLSSDQTQPNWNDLATYARLLQRVCYIFGKAVRESVTDVAPTYLTNNIFGDLEGSGLFFK
ncbi:putative GMP synthase [Daphnia magna]|uniref:Putative GMP synthase n=1 Tax=Daphnia magna TaxID=35525 RepID=A0A164YUZ6_9CRUS|nr:putative GMP synthase [Daphnia magna]